MERTDVATTHRALCPEIFFIFVRLGKGILSIANSLTSITGHWCVGRAFESERWPKRVLVSISVLICDAWSEGFPIGLDFPGSLRLRGREGEVGWMVMKGSVFFAVGFLLLAGCIYEAPLEVEHTVPVDPALIGLWQLVPKEGEEPDADSRLLILNFSETEYLMSSPVGGEEIQYRAYPIKPGGISCVQLQVIGTDKGEPKWQGGQPKPFMVFSYEVEDGMLVVRSLNGDVVGADLTTTEAMREAFLKNNDNNDLFTDLATYRKVVME